MSLICRFYCDQPLGRKPFQLNRGNPKWSQTWRANHANSYMYCDTFWLQLCNHLAHVIVFWQIKWKNLYVTVPLLLCFTLNLRAISKYKPPGAYIRRGDLTRGFLRYEFQGLIHGGAYTRNFMVCKDLYSKEPKSVTSFTFTQTLTNQSRGEPQLASDWIKSVPKKWINQKRSHCWAPCSLRADDN